MTQAVEVKPVAANRWAVFGADGWLVEVDNVSADGSYLRGKYPGHWIFRRVIITPEPAA